MLTLELLQHVIDASAALLILVANQRHWRYRAPSCGIVIMLDAK
jgi:hypothetical protein